MKLHLVALPHTQVSAEFCGCAYTSKILKFCKMLGRDYEIHLYAPEGPNVAGATLHVCLTDKKRTRICGGDDPNRLPAWPTDAQTELFNRRVIRKLNPDPQDLILLSGGWTHHVISEVFASNIKCEPFVGYMGVLAGNVWAAYESNFHMAQVYRNKGIENVRWFDRVIPPFYDPEDFPHFNNGNGEYLLFLGRIIERKGPHIAAEVAQRCGLPLKVAGAGGKQEGKDIVAPEITIKNAEYVGPVDVQERAKLLAGAKAVLFPTIYGEPGGNVAIEAMACGTPVIASDFGVATETVKEGVSGFRFRLLRDAVRAVGQCSELDPKVVRKHAITHFSLESVGLKFTQWFSDIQTLFGQGWYT
jgi:glycosyltransferase involved in cell wall biosynthesis